MAHTSSSARVRSLAGVISLAVGLLLGSVAFAPSAWSWHPDAFGGVDCTDQEILLRWRTVSWMGDNFWGPDYYNSDVRVYMQYGDDDGPIGGITDQQIGSGAFTDQSLAFEGTEVLTPPAGATRVRVHADALALWASGNATIPHAAQTTPWMLLPTGCDDTTTTTVGDSTTTTVGDSTTTTVADTTTTTMADTTTTTVADTTTTTVADTTTTTVADSTTTTVGDTTSTTLAGGIDDTTSTTVTAVVGGVSAQRPTAVAAASVATQAVATQSLPNTGSSSGLLVAGAVVLMALGGGLLAASRQPATVALARDKHSRQG